MMSRINIEIREISNGFLVEDDYEENATFVKTFDEAAKLANKRFRAFNKNEFEI